MTPEQIKKEIEMKELLNIPYDSGMYKLFENRTKVQVSNIGLKFTKQDDELKLIINNANSEYNGRTDFISFINAIYSDFILAKDKSYWNEAKTKEEFKTYLTSEDGDRYEVYNNFKLSEIISILYTRLLKNKRPFLNLETIVLTPIDKRIALYQELNGNPEEEFKKVFHPSIKSDRLDGRKPTSSWRSPFPSDCLKHMVLMMDKQKALFTIEYLWGKKINTNANGGEIMRVLAALPNTNFRINDLQVLKKFTDNLHRRDVKSLKSHFESCGIKPASNLRRWRKKLTVDTVNGI